MSLMLSCTDVLQANIKQGLLAFWNLETNLQDSHRFGNHLQLAQSGSGVTTSFGNYNSVIGKGTTHLIMRDDGTSGGYLEAANTVPQVNNTSFTFGGWFGVVGGSSQQYSGRGFLEYPIRIYSGATIASSQYYLQGSSNYLSVNLVSGTSDPMAFVIVTYDVLTEIMTARSLVNGTSATATVAKANVSFPLFNALRVEGAALGSSVIFANWMFWFARILTEAEIQYLYNSGAGRSYSQL